VFVSCSLVALYYSAIDHDQELTSTSIMIENESKQHARKCATLHLYTCIEQIMQHTYPITKSHASEIII
jgi:hypothetical protein